MRCIFKMFHRVNQEKINLPIITVFLNAQSPPPTQKLNFMISELFAQYTLVAGQNIYKSFLSCAITFYSKEKYCNNFLLYIITICLYTKKYDFYCYNCVYGHCIEKEFVALTWLKYSLPQIHSELYVSSHCKSEYCIQCYIQALKKEKRLFL